MLAVPLMTYLLKEEEKKAHATAIFIILPLSIMSGFIYFNKIDLDLSKLIPVSVGVFFGGILGACLLKKLKNKFISILFAILMIISGVRMLF